jgi:hypothetical protein
LPSPQNAVVTAFRKGSWVASPQFGGDPPRMTKCWAARSASSATAGSGARWRSALLGSNAASLRPTAARSLIPRRLKPFSLWRNSIACCLCATPSSCRAGSRRGRKAWWQYPTTAELERRPSRRPFHQPPNVLITPHSSSSTEATADRPWSAAAANLDQFARGENLENVVRRT